MYAVVHAFQANQISLPTGKHADIAGQTEGNGQVIDSAVAELTRCVRQFVRQAITDRLVEGGACVSAAGCTAVHAAVLLASTEVACCSVCQLVVNLPSLWTVA